MTTDDDSPAGDIDSVGSDEQLRPRSDSLQAKSVDGQNIDLLDRGPRGWRAYLRALGPGLVTGASDDDPSGIATYAQTGAQFGFGMLWVALITFPLARRPSAGKDRNGQPSRTNEPEREDDRGKATRYWTKGCSYLIAPEPADAGSTRQGSYRVSLSVHPHRPDFAGRLTSPLELAPTPDPASPLTLFTFPHARKRRLRTGRQPSGNREPEAPINTALRRFPTSSCPSGLRSGLHNQSLVAGTAQILSRVMGRLGKSISVDPRGSRDLDTDVRALHLTGVVQIAASPGTVDRRTIKGRRVSPCRWRNWRHLPR